MKLLFLTLIGLMVVSQTEVLAQNTFDVEPFAFRTETSNGLAKELEPPFDYKGEPILFKSFKIYSNVTLAQEYTDNVLSIEEGAESDLITIINPSIEIQRNFGRHNMIVQADIEARQHWDRTEDNVENYNLKLNGNLEAKRGINIPLQFIYRDAHLKRVDQVRSNISQIVKSPLNVKLTQFDAGLEYKPNRLGLNMQASYKQFRLGNENFINGGLLIRDNRNVNSAQAIGRISYDLKNGLSPFMSLTYANEDFINEQQNQVSRNNNFLKISNGIKLNYKGLVYGSISAGVESRFYDDSAVGDTNDVAFNTSLTWEPQAKTQFKFDANRVTFEDNLLFSAVTETGVGIGVRHELQHDLFAQGNLSFKNSQFDDLNRTDKIYETNLGIVKIINPQWQVGGEYTFITRDSTVSGLNIDNNIMQVHAKLSF